MGELQDEGLALHIGLSNVGVEDLRRCEALRHVETVQNELSLIVQDDRQEVLSEVRDVGAGYLAYSPLGLGLLTGAITADTRYHPQDFRGGTRGEIPEPFQPENLPGNLERVQKLRSVAERLGTSLGVVALRWVVQQQGVTAAIAGSRNPDHVRSNADAGSVVLDDATLAEVDEIFADLSGADEPR
jgi:aryl-alcohol dehydrogenase-like predicted oxidoreductase